MEVELDWQRKREPGNVYQLEVELEMEVGVDTAFPLELPWCGTHGRIFSLALTQASSGWNFESVFHLYETHGRIFFLGSTHASKDRGSHGDRQ